VGGYDSSDSDEDEASPVLPLTSQVTHSSASVQSQLPSDSKLVAKKAPPGIKKSAPPGVKKAVPGVTSVVDSLSSNPAFSISDINTASASGVLSNASPSPSIPSSLSASAVANPVLPGTWGSWQECQDLATKGVYFWNTETNVTTWERPALWGSALPFATLSTARRASVSPEPRATATASTIATAISTCAAAIATTNSDVNVKKAASACANGSRYG